MANKYGVIAVVLVLGSAYAEAGSLELIDDEREVVTIESGQFVIEAPEPFEPFFAVAQSSTVTTDRLFGTGRASSPGDGTATTTRSVYSVRFRVSAPTRLNLSTMLLVSPPQSDAVAEVSLVGSSSIWFGGQVFEAQLGGAADGSALNLNEEIPLTTFYTYTLTVLGRVLESNDGAFASWLLDATAVDAPDLDSDGDGVPDVSDNCIRNANPSQTDTDGDGHGNRCDIDFNNDCIPGVIDLGILRTVFFTDAEFADINDDGVVNLGDLGLFRTLFFQPPGPSAAGFCNQAG